MIDKLITRPTISYLHYTFPDYNLKNKSSTLIILVLVSCYVNAERLKTIQQR